jgi:hypothetical protein
MKEPKKFDKRFIVIGLIVLVAVGVIIWLFTRPKEEDKLTFPPIIRKRDSEQGPSSQPPEFQPAPTGFDGPSPGPTDFGGPSPAPTGFDGPSPSPIDFGGPSPAPTGFDGPSPAPTCPQSCEDTISSFEQSGSSGFIHDFSECGVCTNRLYGIRPENFTSVDIFNFPTSTVICKLRASTSQPNDICFIYFVDNSGQRLIIDEVFSGIGGSVVLSDRSLYTHMLVNERILLRISAVINIDEIGLFSVNRFDAVETFIIPDGEIDIQKLEIGNLNGNTKTSTPTGFDGPSPAPTGLDGLSPAPLTRISCGNAGDDMSDEKRNYITVSNPTGVPPGGYYTTTDNDWSVWDRFVNTYSDAIVEDEDDNKYSMNEFTTFTGTDGKLYKTSPSFSDTNSGFARFYCRNPN